ncbi:hypothetical protein WN48_10142 [Eufriesea mexicana]|nr:hypothetical protein WN48_10142 [Eufriesea mexicana]
MASSALEEKINKIRQQNEEIRRRYEEVEEDKKNAAKLNALVQMVPSTDWPERKEPPEFLNSPKIKLKSTKEKHEYTLQSHIGEGKKIHSFSQGEGPPPDPKYNFLADSEREEPTVEYTKENSGSRSHHKATRGSFRKKMNGRESNQKDNKSNKGNYRDESQPGYDAWRAERNRIDEDRINRQRTAEGNWHDGAKKLSRPILGDFTKKDYKDSDRRYHANNNEHVNYTRSGNHRPHRGSTKNFYSNYENRSHNTYDQHRNNIAALAKSPVSPTSEERTVVATEKSIKVIVNQSNVTKGQLMSVKVNSPSIAGTGRVGPRQRTRVTYSQSDVDASPTEGEPFFRQKSFEDKSKGTFSNNQKFPNLKRSHSQKKKENEIKYQYHQRKDVKKEDNDGNSCKYYENEFKSFTQKDQQKSYSIKSPKPSKGNMKLKHDSSSVDVSQKCEIQECSISNEVKFGQNNIEHTVDQNIEHTVDQNIEYNIEQDIEHNVEQNIEYTVEENIEHDIITKNSSTLQEIKSEAIEIPNTENVQSNIENEVTNEILLVKEVEMKEISLTSISSTDNSEHIAKDITNKNSFENKNECPDLLANKVTENLQENCNMSSEVSVPNDIQFNEELMSNKSEVLDNVEIDQTFLHKDDQQSLKQVTKQFVDDDCDNIEDEVMVQQNIKEITDNSVFSLEEKTYSVIEINNQSVCNNKLTEKNNESSDKNLKNTLNSCEIKSKNTLSPINVGESSVKEIKEKIEETDTKEELINKKNDKTLQ